MKIIFCTDGIAPYFRGGMQSHSRLLIEALAAHSDIQLEVIHPHEGTEIFQSLLNVNEHTIPPLPGQRNYLLECFESSKTVLEIIKKHPEGIVYSQGLSVWSGIDEIKDRLIINPHGLEAFQAIGIKSSIVAIPFRLVFSYLLRKAKYIVALGGRLTQILESRFGSAKVVVLSNAVNCPAQQSIKTFEHPMHFLFVGRFAFNKGLHILLEAVRKLNLSGKENEFVFDLVGAGPLLEKFRTQHNYSNVNYLGSLDDDALTKLYIQCDALILPTLFEGMPTVVLEAMGHGTPIIVTDVGATRELVDERNGFIIEKGSVNSLFDAILSFASLENERKQELGNHSRTKVQEHFTWDIVASAHIKVFESML